MQALPEIIGPPSIPSAPAVSSCDIDGTTESAYLNDDILLQILALSSRREICALMRTCRMFHYHGAKHLLQSGVSLATDAQIASFMLFMTVGDPNRDPTRAQRIMLLRDLTLSRRRSDVEQSPAVLPPGGAGMLLTALFQMLGVFGCLTILTIYDSETVLDLHPGLLDAIAALQTIRELNVSFAGPRTVKLLKALRSSLYFANISIDSDARMNEAEQPLEDQNPMWLLQGSQHTLRSLSATFSVSAPDSPQYPRVTRLYLSYTDVPQTQHYVRAFPNLLSLETYDCLGWGDGEDFEEWRARNRAEQEALGTWSSLRSYSGTILTLYQLALRCSVRSVDINHFEEELDPELLRTVLGDTRPERLKLAIDGGYWLLDPDFLATFAHPGVEGVKRFELVVGLEPEDQDLDLSALLNSVVARVVVPLRALVSFRLTFGCSSIATGTLGRPRSVESCPLRPVEAALAAWDMEGFARRIQSEVRAPGTLQSISMRIQGHRTRESQAVSLDSNGQVTDGLSDDDDGEDS